MKYDEVIFKSNGDYSTLTVKGLSADELESLSEEGQFLCPGKNCMAKLCLVHSSKNGGRTCFLKAVDDESHVADCEYKIANYIERNAVFRTDGIFTEKQVNDAVRRIYVDYTKPVDGTKADRKKKKKNEGPSKRGTVKGKNIGSAAGGRIVYGEEGEEGIKGRMRRRYAVSSADIGIMTTLCGRAKSMHFNKHNELIIQFEDERLSNIAVMIGAVYEHNNPVEYNSLYLAKQYFDKNVGNRDVIVAAGGLVTSHNGDLILELQANGSLRVDNQTIMKMVVDKVKEAED